MKKCCLAAFICLAALRGFSQERTTDKNTAPKPAAIATLSPSDSVSTDKNVASDEPRRKKAKRVRNKKECSRMKS